jgi:hypothetical protein
MSNGDELEQIMEDFDLEIESGDSPDAQSERLETLHQEGEITDEEFELLRTVFIDSDEPSMEASETPNSKDREPTDWLPEETVNEIISSLKIGIEGSDPYSDDTSYHSVILEIAALPPETPVAISCTQSGRAPTALLHFNEREHEERFREYVAQNPPYEIGLDMSDDSTVPQMGVEFNVIPSGYDGELSEEDVMIEVNHLFRMISHLYGMTMSELSAGSISVEALE